MFNRIYRLIDTRKIACFQREMSFDEDTVVVKPLFLSICQADQRYFQGQRRKDIMKKKLPMALIHEGLLEVLYDKKGEFKNGDKVVVVPNFSENNNSKIKKNYHTNSKFLSSNADGLMQDILMVRRESLVRTNCDFDDNSIYALTELLSVAYNGYNIFREKTKNDSFEKIGIWGDGPVSYCLALVLKYELPKIQINLFGKHKDKMMMFSFVDNTYEITGIPEGLVLDHCFECVGGKSSEEAINQMINYVSPQGIISLLGVCEYAVSINTRDILAKGITMIGHSRSEKEDFEKSIYLIENDKYTRNYLKKIMTLRVEVDSINSMINAFDKDMLNDFKTIMKWNL